MLGVMHVVGAYEFERRRVFIIQYGSAFYTINVNWQSG